MLFGRSSGPRYSIESPSGLKLSVRVIEPLLKSNSLVTVTTIVVSGGLDPPTVTFVMWPG